MFGVGAPEALVIGVVALLVFGPKGLAEVSLLVNVIIESCYWKPNPQQDYEFLYYMWYLEFRSAFSRKMVVRKLCLNVVLEALFEKADEKGFRRNTFKRNQ